MWEQQSQKNVSLKKKNYVSPSTFTENGHTHVQRLFNQKLLLFDIWYSINKCSFPLFFYFLWTLSWFPYEFLKILTSLLLINYWFIGLFAFTLGFVLKEPRKQKLEKPIGMQIHPSSHYNSFTKTRSCHVFNSFLQNSPPKYLLSNYYAPLCLALIWEYLSLKQNKAKQKINT